MGARAVACAAGALLVRCGPTGPEPTWVTPGWPSDATGQAELVEIAEPDLPAGDWYSRAPGPLTGWFGGEAVVRAEIAGAPLETRQALLMRSLQEGTWVQQQIVVCELSLPSVEGLAELTIPPEVQGLIRQKSEILAGDFLSSPNVGATWTPPAQRVTLGVDFGTADAGTTPLPNAASPLCGTAPPVCALDEDEDGHPGISMVANLILCPQGPETLYIALRSVLSMQGAVGEGHDTLEGGLTPTLEWSVLGTSDPCLEPAQSIVPTIVPGSTFALVRVDGAGGWPVNLDGDGDGVVRCSDVLGALDGELAPYLASE